jgi:acetyl esterase/lipase
LECAELLDQCCRRLSLIGPSSPSLSDLGLYLSTTERQIHTYIITILSDAGEKARPFVDDCSIMVTAARLQTVRGVLNANWRGTAALKTGGVNSLLFYLINTLQLCLQRIEDADRILCGEKAAAERTENFHTDINATYNSSGSSATSTVLTTTADLASRQKLTNTIFRWTKRVLVSAGVGGVMYYAMDRNQSISSTRNKEQIAKTAGKIVMLTFGRSLLLRKYEVWRLHARIEDSTQSLSMWQQKWIIVSAVIANNSSRNNKSYNNLIAEPSAEDVNKNLQGSARRLLEALPMQSNKGAFWYSQGALRLLLVRHVMDLLYASVGTAMDITGPTGGNGLWVPLSGLCASYYAIAGPAVTSTAAAHQVAQPSMDFVKRAWGMVSIPPIKWLAMEGARIMKGVSLIERIWIAGVPCLVISQGPQPCVKAAIKRTKRQLERSGSTSVIAEEEPEYHDAEDESEESAGRKNLNNYEAKNVVFHITGGGWFIHTTATDVPYLSEWSAETDSIIVTPEYDLLPEHHFPKAINQVTDVYCALMNGDACSSVGFRVKKIVVTGESAGGNLAAALLVKLCHDKIVDVDELLLEKKRSLPVRQESSERLKQLMGAMHSSKEDVTEADEDDAFEDAKDDNFEADEAASPATPTASGEMSTPTPKSPDENEVPRMSKTPWMFPPKVRMPDALMLCCPALNMSHSISPSRVMGTGDPVLPSGLIQMISVEYLPDSLGIPRTHPIASPYFASDKILACFPRTMLWVSASDPLLDDSVDFNTRLRRVGTESSVHAAQHMPHAFWGLANAGFPEAIKVQNSCKAFLREAILDCHRTLPSNTY